MTGSEQPIPEVARLPLGGPDASDIAVLVAVVRRLSIARSVEEIMQVVTQAARTLLRADGVTFVLRDGELCYYAEEDAISPLWKGARFPMSACISGWCMVQAKAVIIRDIYQDPRIPHDAYKKTFVRSLVMVPVRQERPIAAIGAYWAELRDTTPADLELLQTIANSAALAVAYVELQEERRKSAETRTTNVAPNSVGQQLRQAITALRIKTRGMSEVAGWRESSESQTAGQQAEGSGLAALIQHRLRPTSGAAYSFALGCVAVATIARWTLGLLVSEEIVPFATYFPAVLVAALVGGVGSGVLALALGALIGWWAFMPPYFSFQTASLADGLSLALYVVTAGLIVWVAERYRGAFLQLTAEEGKRLLLVNELQHRIRNTLGVVQAIVSQSLRGDAEQAEKINRRIQAISATNDLLSQSEHQRAGLSSILLSELSPYGAARFMLKGDDVSLAPVLARALALIFHELATNAAKYGAFSTPAGCVSVAWAAVAGRVTITWSEKDGPPVVPPLKRGFGTMFIKRVLSSVQGSVETEFRPDGIVCEISFVQPDSELPPTLL